MNNLSCPLAALPTGRFANGSMWALAGANKGRGGEAQKKGRAIKPPGP